MGVRRSRNWETKMMDDSPTWILKVSRMMAGLGTGSKIQNQVL